jgi:sugar phosphate isomerase/epimerase
MAMDDRPAIFSYFGFELPLGQRLELIRRAGFVATALWWGPPEELFIQGRLHEAPAMARDAGLTVENLHVPYEQANDIWSSRSAQRQAFVDRHITWLDECAGCGVGCMVLHVTHGEHAPAPTPQGVEAFGAVVRAARQRGVRLALENTRRRDALDALLAGYGDEHVGLCFDSSHDHLWGRPAGVVLRQWGHRMFQTHFSDAVTDRDRHMLPRDGILNWMELARDFPRQTYGGPVMLEVMPPWEGSPLAMLSEAMERWRWLSALLAGKAPPAAPAGA